MYYTLHAITKVMMQLKMLSISYMLGDKDRI
jgi:hypothetical protein